MARCPPVNWLSFSFFMIDLFFLLTCLQTCACCTCCHAEKSNIYILRLTWGRICFHLAEQTWEFITSLVAFRLSQFLTVHQLGKVFNCRLSLIQEITEYYVKHSNGPERWQTPPVLEELKVKNTKIHMYAILCTCCPLHTNEFRSRRTFMSQICSQVRL